MQRTWLPLVCRWNSSHHGYCKTVLGCYPRAQENDGSAWFSPGKMSWTHWLDTMDRRDLPLRNIVLFSPTARVMNTFVLSSLGLFWSLFRASNQRQCGCGLRGIGRDAGQWLPLGYWVQHPQRTDKAPHHSPDGGQHHHRWERFVGVGGAAWGWCSPKALASPNPWESHFTFHVLWVYPKL